MLPLDILLRPLLLPVILVQAIGVRRRTLSLPEAIGPRKGNSGIGPELRLLIVGDSSAAGVGVHTQSEALSGQLVKALEPEFSVTWRLIAKTGATCQSTLEMLIDDRIKHTDTFDVVFIALGVNDAVRLRSKKRFCAVTKRSELSCARNLALHQSLFLACPRLVGFLR